MTLLGWTAGVDFRYTSWGHAAWGRFEMYSMGPLYVTRVREG